MEKGKEVINEPFWTHPDGGKEIIMNTYITKQQAIDAFDSPDVDWYYGDVDPESVIRVIESIPAADVREVKRGRWINQRADSEMCSACGTRFYVSALFAVGGNDEPNFCPNCGANMREET